MDEKQFLEANITLREIEIVKKVLEIARMVFGESTNIISINRNYKLFRT